MRVFVKDILYFLERLSGVMGENVPVPFLHRTFYITMQREMETETLTLCNETLHG